MTMHNLARRTRSPFTRTDTFVQRRERAADMPMPWFGQYACTWTPHPFAPMFPTVGEPLCGDCFGWSDDVRHPVALR